LMPQRRLRRALIAHWYTPPYLVDLVDLVASPECEPAAMQTVKEAVEAMGKVPIVFRKFIPGYIANRIQAAVQDEVQFLIDEGYATAQDIDDSALHGIALRLAIIGVMAKADFTGLPLLQATLKNRMYHPPPEAERSASLDALVGRGDTGVMGGKGFYDWGGRAPAALFEERDRKLIALKRALRGIGAMAGRAVKANPL
nr:3-hydroxyacyl-CoA dehydrogenase family protein [Rubritepida sp.]